MEMCDMTLPDRGLKKYYENEMTEWDPLPSLIDKDEYEWCILADWHSSCDFETKEELEFLESLVWRWQDFVEEGGEYYESSKRFYESILQEV